NGMAGRFARDLLKTQGRSVKEFQSAGDALQKVRMAPLGLFISRPEHVAHLRHGREAVLHLRRIALGLPRITPRPINAQTTFARRVLTRNMILIVGACGVAHDSLSSSVVQW